MDGIETKNTGQGEYEPITKEFPNWKRLQQEKSIVQRIVIVPDETGDVTSEHPSKIPIIELKRE